MIQKTSEEDPVTNLLSVTSRSRDVRHGYYIHSSLDIPERFQITVPRSEWFRAMFIPGDAGLSLAGRNPARIFLLTRDRLTVVSHSDSEEHAFVTKLSELVELYSHKKQGLGELVFTSTTQSTRFSYSPVQRQCIDVFLSALRSLWLRSVPTPPQESHGRSNSLRGIASFSRTNWILANRLSQCCNLNLNKAEHGLSGIGSAA